MGIVSAVTFKNSVTLNFLLRVSRNNTEVKMKKLISAILILCLCLGIYSCSKKSDEDDLKESTTTDTTAPILAPVTVVTTPNNDTTPAYTFSSTEAGTITYGEAAPVPLQRHRQVITQSPSVHSVTVPTMTAQSW